MAILKFKLCKKCNEKTYHRYKNSLRCRFTPEDTWQCVNCSGKRRKRSWYEGGIVGADDAP